MLIKSNPSNTQHKPQIVSQKTISVFLTPSKPSPFTAMSLAARKSSMINRIREKATANNQPNSLEKSASAAWDRGEWCISGLFMCNSLTKQKQADD